MVAPCHSHAMTTNKTEVTELPQILINQLAEWAAQTDVTMAESSKFDQTYACLETRREVLYQVALQVEQAGKLDAGAAERAFSQARQARSNLPPWTACLFDGRIQQFECWQKLVEWLEQQLRGKANIGIWVRNAGAWTQAYPTESAPVMFAGETVGRVTHLI